jgi:hypothetical protein
MVIAFVFLSELLSGLPAGLRARDGNHLAFVGLGYPILTEISFLVGIKTKKPKKWGTAKIRGKS